MKGTLKERVWKKGRRSGLILAAALMLAIPGVGVSYGAESVPQDLIPRPINRISQPSKSEPASTPASSAGQWTTPSSYYAPSTTWHPTTTHRSSARTRKVKVNTLNESTVSHYKVKQLKTGRSALTFRWGLVNFKAPRTKTYTFTFTDLTGGKSVYDQQIKVMFFSGSNSVVVRTQYGKSDTIGMMSARLSKKLKADAMIYPSCTFAKKHVVKIKIKKGKSVQLGFLAPDMT